MVKPQWLDQIYEDKDIEIRGQPCMPKIGQRIFLCPSGASAVTGTAVVADCLGPLTRQQFDELRPRHKVPGASPYAKTYAWVLIKRQRVTPQAIIRSNAVIWQRGPGCRL